MAAEQVTRAYGVDIPTTDAEVRTSDPAGYVADVFESLAARLRSGELKGASGTWAEHHTHLVTVEVSSSGELEENGEEYRMRVEMKRTRILDTRPNLAVVRK